MKITLSLDGKLYIFNNEHDMLRYINKETDVVATLKGTTEIKIEDIEGGQEVITYKWEEVITIN